MIAQTRAERLGEQRRRGRREHVGTRGLDERRDHGGMRGDERPGDAGRLAERAHVDDALRGEAEVCERPAAPVLAGTQHAEAVRVVDDEPRVECVGQRGQRRQRREVAVHAEHRVGRDQLAPGRRRRDTPFERRDVAVGIADEFRPRQRGAVVEARVIQAVGEDRVAASRKRGQDREVREIARRERQRLRAGTGPHERGELGFERSVRCGVPADDVGRARADSPARAPSRAAATTSG